MADKNQITLTDVRRLHLEEGDTLVVFVPELMSADMFRAVRQMLSETFPENRWLAMPDSMRLEVVSKIEEGEDDVGSHITPI